jgi:hypothetical protein
VEKAFLNNVFGLAPVTHDAEGNSKDKTGIAVKQNFQGCRIVSLQAKHRFVIAGYTEFCEFWR